MTNRVQMDTDQVTEGSAAWTAAATSAQARWQAAANAIRALAHAGTWGGDAAGNNFAGVYQPEETLARVDEVFTNGVYLGDGVAYAAGVTKAADEEQAAEMERPVQGL